MAKITDETIKFTAAILHDATAGTEGAKNEPGYPRHDYGDESVLEEHWSGARSKRVKGVLTIIEEGISFFNLNALSSSILIKLTFDVTVTREYIADFAMRDRDERRMD